MKITARVPREQTIPRTGTETLLSSLRAALPEGRALPDDIWKHRHRAILILLWLHVVGVTLFGALTEEEFGHVLLETMLVAVCGLLAGSRRLTRRLRATFASMGLITSSALLVHFSGGYIEFHFHFFVMVVVIALYQDWLPLLLTIGYVALHHGLVGVLAPTSVYNHPDAWANPWKWAAIHAAFILAISAATLVNWRLNEAARAKVELTLGSVGEGILGVDSRGEITLVNPAAAIMLGTSVERLSGRPLASVLDTSERIEDDRSGPGRSTLIAKTIQEGTVLRTDDARFRRGDGTSLPVEYVITPLKQHGRIAGAIIAFNDITERKQAEETLRRANEELEMRVAERTVELQRANEQLQRELVERKQVEEALRESEQRYRALFAAEQRQARELALLDRVHTAITRELDLSVIYRTVVQAISSTFGYSHVSLYRLENRELWLQHQVGYDRVLAMVRLGQGVMSRAVETGEALLVEDVSADPDYLPAIEGVVSQVSVPLFDEEGVVGVLNLESTGTPLTTDDLRLIETVGKQVNVAITRSRLYTDVRQSEERFKIVARATNDVVWDWDITTGKVWLNEGIETQFGYRSDEVEYSLEWWTSLLHPDDEQEVISTLQAALESDTQYWSDECRLKRADGSYAYVYDRGFIIRDASGRAVRMIGAMMDISERKQAEEELREYAAKLKESNQALQEFASVASHDLQEPLRKIQAFGDRLKSKMNGSTSPEALDYLERMQSAANRMQTLIQDLLTYSRVTSKAQPFARVDLNRVVRDVLSDLEVRVEQSGAQIEVGELPVVQADATQMRQLFQNLIGNALKFQRPGVPPVVRIESEWVAWREPVAQLGARTGGWVCITVRDNGIGFDEKHRERIFALFERLHGRSEYEGTGIGLAVCKRIVERHGGTIAASGAVNEGATFEITLPVAQAEAAPVKEKVYA